MNQKNFITIFVCFVNLLASAQEKSQGFYFNPNLTLSHQLKNPNGNNFRNYNSLLPSISFGYLKGEKIRQNISTNFDGTQFYRNSGYINWNAQYGVNFRVLHSKRLNLFLTPYVKSSIGYGFSKYNYNSGMMNKTRGFNANVMLGGSLNLEYKIGKRVDFISSLGLNVLGMNYHNFKDNNTENQSFNLHTVPSFEANVGIRINLFRRK